MEIVYKKNVEYPGPVPRLELGQDGRFWNLKTHKRHILGNLLWDISLASEGQVNNSRTSWIYVAVGCIVHKL